METANHEIDAFEEENLNWPPRVETRAMIANSPPTVLLLGALVVFSLITGPWTPENPWFTRGACAADRVFQHGEWWRLVTALTLHSGPVHIAGNTLIGGVIVHLLCRQMGSGLGVFLLLLAGALGNYVNILVRGAPHISVGFSTSVFGALGLLAGQGIMARRSVSWRNMFLPFAAALGLLGILGTSGEQTDLGAHLFGMGAGLVLGLIADFFVMTARPVLLRGLGQGLLLLLSLGLVIFSWLAAFEVP